MRKPDDSLLYSEINILRMLRLKKDMAMYRTYRDFVIWANGFSRSTFYRRMKTERPNSYYKMMLGQLGAGKNANEKQT